MTDKNQFLDNRFEKILEFEKSLPSTLKRLSFDKISIWSLVRIELISGLFGDERFEKKIQIQASISQKKSQEMRWLGFGEIYKLLKLILFSPKEKTLVRVCSFSLQANDRNEIVFKNANFQKIFEAEKNVIVLVNNINGYKISISNEKVIIFPPLVFKLITLMGKIKFGTQALEATKMFTKYFNNSEKQLQRMLEYKLGSIIFFRSLDRLLKIKKAYFESPNGCFESEIIASKMAKVQNTEVYHGVVTTLEPSYNYEHLDFNGNEHGVCETFLAASEKQKKLLSKINPYYKKIEVLKYEMNPSLEREYYSKMGDKKRKDLEETMLIVTGISDGAIANTLSYLENNRESLKNYKSCTLRLHPVDFEERWEPITSQFPSIVFSQDSLINDIIRSKKIVIACATTVSLQLSYLGIPFEIFGDDLA